jgi:glucose/mannose-6-phosphate isomerase
MNATKVHDLDDIEAMGKLDTQNMMGEIDNLPNQLESAYNAGLKLPTPDPTGVQYIIISGMGGSAIGADLLASFLAPSCRLPIIVHRDYDLPQWAQGPEVLVIASSHSGNTEETLSSFTRAITKGCKAMAITTGGKLAEEAKGAGVPLWIFEHAGQPRAAVGFSFGLLLAAIFRMGLIPSPDFDVNQAVQSMKRQQENLKLIVPVSNNPAKRLAGQLHGRLISIFGADFLAPVARRWKGQMSEVAKSWAQFEYLPEADHNTLAGLVNPAKELEHAMFLFLKAPSDHPRNSLRIDLTRQIFMQEGMNTDVIEAKGEIPLAHMWTTLHLGDYTAYYLAMSYGVDPTPVAAIQNLKREMVK